MARAEERCVSTFGRVVESRLNPIPDHGIVFGAFVEEPHENRNLHDQRAHDQSGEEYVLACESH